MDDETRSLEFAFDSCCTALLEQGATVDACLKRFPAQQRELEPLLRLTVSLSNARSVQPGQEFRWAASRRMQNLIAERTRDERRDGKGKKVRIIRADNSHLWGLRIRVQVLLALFLGLFFLVCTGIVVVSAESLPGEALYPVKHAGEELRLSLAFTYAAQTKLRMQYADERLKEAQRLASIDRTFYFQQTMQQYSRLIQDEASYLDVQSPLSEEEKGRLAQQIALALRQQETRLTELERIAPYSLLPSIENAQKVRQQALQNVEQEDLFIPESLLPFSSGRSKDINGSAPYPEDHLLSPSDSVSIASGMGITGAKADEEEQNDARASYNGKANSIESAFSWRSRNSSTKPANESDAPMHGWPSGEAGMEFSDHWTMSGEPSGGKTKYKGGTGQDFEQNWFDPDVDNPGPGNSPGPGQNTGDSRFHGDKGRSGGFPSKRR